MATTEEWREGLHQTSHCYRGRLLESTGTSEARQDRIADGLVHEWISVDAALEKMRASRPTSQLGRYSKERDLYFVEAYTRVGDSLLYSKAR